MVSSTSTLVSHQDSSGSGGFPPLDEIKSAQLREQVLTHPSLTTTRRDEFEAFTSNPNQDNEGYVDYDSLRT